MSSPRTNLNASRPPTTIDAADKGYGVGSRWHDKVHSRKYTCTSGTKDAAVWIEDYADAGTTPDALTTAERVALTPIQAQLCYDTDDGHLHINI